MADRKQFFGEIKADPELLKALESARHPIVIGRTESVFSSHVSPRKRQSSTIYENSGTEPLATV